MRFEHGILETNRGPICAIVYTQSQDTIYSFVLHYIFRSLKSPIVLCIVERYICTTGNILYFHRYKANITILVEMEL